MDRTERRESGTEAGFGGDVSATGATNKPTVEPDSWWDLTEFVDQFDDPVFGVLADPEDSPKGFWIVRDVEKVRPAAVPIDQGPTFDMAVIGPGGKVVDDIRLTIDEIEHVRAAEHSNGPPIEGPEDE
jgi:hypothetical protein